MSFGSTFLYITRSFVTDSEPEKAILDSITAFPKASLVAVYGRRRVGKTYLIRTHLQKQIVFQFSAVYYVTAEVQLEQFTTALSKQLNKGIDLPVPANWFKAFELLSKLLAKKLHTKKSVVFLDEFPWMQTPKSNFFAAFEHFWNTWAAQENNPAVILCGSAASWMLQEVVRQPWRIAQPYYPQNTVDTIYTVRNRTVSEIQKHSSQPL